MPADRLQQIIYESRAAAEIDTNAILDASRHNNALDGITGVLWIDGTTIVQILEGPTECQRSLQAHFPR